MGRDGVAVVQSRGCSRLLVGFPDPLGSVNDTLPPKPMSVGERNAPSSGVGPFAGLVVCVTGLSNEARKQVMVATERLGGKYSSSLHPRCSHLVVQSFGGRKFDHAMKHGLKNGLSVVTLGWFIDSVRRNARQNESLYDARSVAVNGLPLNEFNKLAGYATPQSSCLPSMLYETNSSSNFTPRISGHSTHKESMVNKGSVFENKCFYVDSNIPDELKKKVVDALKKENVMLLEHWFVGCRASHVVCEATDIQKYLGNANNIVTPLWILKTLKEKNAQRLVYLSTDMARQVALLLENTQDAHCQSEFEITNNLMDPLTSRKAKETHEGRQRIADLAKNGVRNRRWLHMQSCQTPLRPITPSNLLDSICWTISEPPSTAGLYLDSAGTNDACDHHASEHSEQADRRNSEVAFDNVCRSMRESEKVELVFKSHFLTILFPVDRFGELGPMSKSYFSEGGFTCSQLLDLIYSFYQENMSADEVSVAIHTDSRHGDCLRLIYSSQESIDRGLVTFKRVDFLGSRRSFEGLKRVTGENNGNVYQLLIRA